jgi:hypothetical protein
LVRLGHSSAWSHHQKGFRIQIVFDRSNCEIKYFF